MIKTLAIAALLAAPTTPTKPQCVTKRQIADAAMTMTPYLVQAVMEKCRTHVAADSFLATKGQAFHDRLKSEGAGREASAAQVLLAVMGGDTPPIEDSESLVKVMGSMMSGMMAKDLPVESCGEIGGMMEALAPLPAENLGLLAASMAGLISQNEKGASGKAGAKANSKFDICKDG